MRRKGFPAGHDGFTPLILGAWYCESTLVLPHFLVLPSKGVFALPLKVYDLPINLHTCCAKELSSSPDQRSKQNEMPSGRGILEDE